MKKNKVIFLIAFFIFLVLIIIISWDISQRTTYPGSKPQLKERILQPSDPQEDTINDMQKRDSL